MMFIGRFLLAFVALAIAAVAAPVYLNEAPASGYIDFNPAPLVTGTDSGHTVKLMQPGQPMRFRGNPSSLVLRTFQNSARNFAVFCDGVLINSGSIPTTPVDYADVTLATGLHTGANHDYEIVYTYPILALTSTNWFDVSLDFGSGSLAAVAHPRRLVVGTYGDSIMAMSNVTPAATTIFTHPVWIAARAAGYGVSVAGAPGGKVHTLGRDGTGIVSPLIDILIVPYGTNDLSDLGTTEGQTNFGASYTTMGGLLVTQINGSAPGKRLLFLQPLPRASGGENRAIAGTIIAASIVGLPNSTYIPTDGWYPTTATYLPDGLHPNDLGYALYGNRLIPIIAATSITISGPSTGSVGTASTNFTVTLANTATFCGDQTVTLTASSGTITATAAGGSVSSNGTSSPTITPASGTSSFTFTVIPSATGSLTVTPTVGQAGWTMPAATTYLAGATATATNVAAGGLTVGTP